MFKDHQAFFAYVVDYAFVFEGLFDDALFSVQKFEVFFKDTAAGVGFVH